MQDFLALFGAELNDPTTKATVPTSDAVGETKTNVMLYFSAHWCPVSYTPSFLFVFGCDSGLRDFLMFRFSSPQPCRRFTPMLMEFYEKMQAKGEAMELVFVSLDNSQQEYNEYVADMPWKCVPFQNDADGSSTKDVRMKLARMYDVEGIPHLVVLGPDRQVITADGTSEVQMDSEGERFPWKPKPLAEILPAKFLTKNGLVDMSTLDNKHLMLYFSAHWW